MRGKVAAVVLSLLAVAAPGAHAAPQGRLHLAGTGGQTAVLDVGRGGLVVDYPFWMESRLAGPDGAVGGVVIQDKATRKLVGGVLLENAPGFEEALGIPLVDFQGTKLPAGHYELTLLGTGRQEVTLPLRGRSDTIELAGKGRPRPSTRTVAADALAVDRWADDIGKVKAHDYLVAGAGGGGTLQQGGYSDFCVRRAQDPCESGGWMFVSPGPGSSSGWSAQLYPPGHLPAGSYSFEGTTIGAGPASTVGHTAVVITLR